jgi:hypothetical protein
MAEVKESEEGKWTERYAVCWSSAYPLSAMTLDSLGLKLTVFRILKGQVPPLVTVCYQRCVMRQSFIAISSFRDPHASS